MIIQQKPSFGALPNLSHPIYRGLRGCWLFNEKNGFIANDVSGNRNQGVMSSGLLWTSRGLAGFGDSSIYHVDCGTPAVLRPPNEFTVEILCKMRSDSTGYRIFVTINTGSTGLWFGASSNIPQLYWGDTSEGTFSGGSLSTSTWYHLVLVIRENAYSSLYINGVYDGDSGVVSSFGWNGDQFAIGHDSNWNNQAAFTDCEFVRFWGRTLTATEIATLYNNLYIGFDLEDSFDGDYSSDIITASITENASATDTPSASIIHSSSITENASGSDILSVNAIYNVAGIDEASASDSQSANYMTGASTTENASGSDSQTANYTTNASITENASASDSSDGDTSLAADIAEDASATDSQSCTFTANVSQTESGSLNDILSAFSASQSSVTENASTTDLCSAIIIASASIEENASVTDIVTTLAIFNTAIVENVSAIDTSDASTEDSGLVTENASAIDLCSATVTASASIEESASAVDTVTTLAIFNSAVVENVSAIDTLDASINYAVSIIENVSSVDTISASILEDNVYRDSILTVLLRKNSVLNVEL